MLTLLAIFAGVSAWALTRLSREYDLDLKRASKAFKVFRRYVVRRLKAWSFLLNSPQHILEAYKKADGKPFVVESPDLRYVFVSNSKNLLEVTKAGDHQLSLHAASKQMFYPQYTMHGFNWHDQRGKEGLGFVRALKGISTAHLPPMVPALITIISHEISRCIAKHRVKGTASIPLYPVLLQLIAKLNSRVFFGNEATSDEEFLEAAIGYIENVFTTAEVLRLLPNAIVPIVGKIMRMRDKTQDKVFGVLMQIVEQRLETRSRESYLHPNELRSNDCVQWIIDSSPKKNPWSAERIVHEVMAMWFGALHALSSSLTYATFDLCIHQKYIASLRAEVESPAYLDFLRTGNGLPLLDSFVKESARLTPFEVVSTRRSALQKFVLSDGTVVNKGDWALTPLVAMNRDSKIYPEAESFHAYRFAGIQTLDKGGVSQPDGASGFIEPSDTWHFWGSGNMVCPGRFYSTTVIKLALSHILLNYDIELADPTIPRSSNWRTTVSPRADARVLFKTRGDGLA